MSSSASFNSAPAGAVMLRGLIACSTCALLPLNCKHANGHQRFLMIGHVSCNHEMAVDRPLWQVKLSFSHCNPESGPAIMVNHNVLVSVDSVEFAIFKVYVPLTLLLISRDAYVSAV